MSVVSAPSIHRWALAALICMLFVGVTPFTARPCLRLRREPTHVTIEEPITPIASLPSSGGVDAEKISLGEHLFNDSRLSRDNARSCDSCHDLNTNGASGARHDVSPDGWPLALNTPTVFNAALNFRFNWDGGFRTLESQAAASIESRHIMGTTIPDVVSKLRADPKMVQQFQAVYGRAPDADSILDAIASFERSLLTPGSKFDRWLEGDLSALSAEELHGYELFKSLGCASCHQGVNVGGNLLQQHGIFRPLASPDPPVVRVPSLRNVAVTPPYFHDGSAPTLDDAIQRMATTQLNSTVTDWQVKAIAAYLRTLTGTFRGRLVVGKAQ